MENVLKHFIDGAAIFVQRSKPSVKTKKRVPEKSKSIKPGLLNEIISTISMVD